MSSLDSIFTKEICTMQSKEKITRANAMDIIRRFAKEYRKTLTLTL